jgi:hypothetical protein
MFAKIARFEWEILHIEREIRENQLLEGWGLAWHRSTFRTLRPETVSRI